MNANLKEIDAQLDKIAQPTGDAAPSMPWDEAELALRENMRELNYNRDLKLRTHVQFLLCNQLNISRDSVAHFSWNVGHLFFHLVLVRL